MRLRTRWIVVPTEKSRGVLEVGLEMIRIDLQTFYNHIHQLLAEILCHLVVLPVRVSAIADHPAWNDYTSAAFLHKTMQYIWIVGPQARQVNSWDFHVGEIIVPNGGPVFRRPDVCEWHCHLLVLFESLY